MKPGSNTLYIALRNAYDKIIQFDKFHFCQLSMSSAPLCDVSFDIDRRTVVVESWDHGCWSRRNSSENNNRAIVSIEGFRNVGFVIKNLQMDTTECCRKIETNNTDISVYRCLCLLAKKHMDRPACLQRIRVKKQWPARHDSIGLWIFASL